MEQIRSSIDLLTYWKWHRSNKSLAVKVQANHSKTFSFTSGLGGWPIE